MSIPVLRGHRETRALLARALETGGLAQSVLLHGPAGVGKERLGLWLAQLLLCERPMGGEPCGQCLPCRLVGRLEHPDVHWFFPLPRPENASSPEKLREKLEEARGAELQARRSSAVHVPAHEKAPAHFLASILTLQQLAAVRPAMGRRKVFLVGDAELMVPQESSPEAANAFLKLLEEPPADTTLVLTSSHPGALLPTIRSRVLPLRVGYLEDDEVREFLEAEAKVEPGRAARLAPLALGAIGRALRLGLGEDGTGSLARQHRAGRELLLAALSAGPVPRLAVAHDQGPTGGRGEFSGELEAFAGWLRDLLAVASGAPEAVRDPEARTLMDRAITQAPIEPEGVARALDRVAEAQTLAAGNVNPQLIVSNLLRRVQADLGRGTIRPTPVGRR